MTVSVQTPSIEYVEDGATVNFPVPFRYRDPSHIKAERQAADGSVSPLAYGTDYTVSVGDTDAGGTLSVSAAAASGTVLAIWRDTPRAQDAEYGTTTSFSAESHENTLDELALVDQEQDDLIDRAPKMPRGEQGLAIPPAAQRLSTLFGFDELGAAKLFTTTAAVALLEAALLAQLPSTFKGDPGSAGEGYATRAAMAAAADTASNLDDMFLTEPGREGKWIFKTGDFSAEVANDPLQGIYVARAGDPTGATGALLRHFDGPINVSWFGAAVDGATDDSAAWQAAIAFMGAGYASALTAPPGTSVAAEIPLQYPDVNIDCRHTVIKNDIAGALSTFVCATNYDFVRSRLRFKRVLNEGTGGHVFDLNGGDLLNSWIEIERLDQNTTAYKILTNENDSGATGRFFWSTFIGNRWSCSTDNTAENLIEYIDTDNTLSEVEFRINDIRPLGAGRFAYFESTSGSGSSHNAVRIKSCGVEKCVNGFATFKGCNVSGIDTCTFYDMDTAQSARFVGDGGGATPIAATDVVTGQTSGASGTVSSVTDATVLDTSGRAGVFSLGETVTGSSSAATGVIEWMSEEQDEFRLTGVSGGPFTTSDTITGGSSTATAGVDTVTENQFIELSGSNGTDWSDGETLTVVGTGSSGDHTVRHAGFISANLIELTNGSGGTSSEQSYCNNIQRNAGVLAPNVVDIYCGSSPIFLRNVGGKLAGANFTVDCQNKNVDAVGVQDANFLNKGRTLTSLTKDRAQVRGISLMAENSTSFRKTIAGGIIEIDGPGMVLVATEGSASTDDLDTIQGGQFGDEIIIIPYTSDDVVVKHDTGNIFLRGLADITLSASNRILKLFYNPISGKWADI